MRTLHYPDGNIPAPYVFNNRDGEHTLIVIALIFIVLVLVLILYNFSPLRNTELLIECPPGECASNLQTGEKRCPISVNTVILRNPQTETCNPVSSCTDPTTPYSLNADGSFNIDGRCPPTKNGLSTCRCVSELKCPSFTQILFTSQNGSKYSTNSQYTFTQTPYVGNTSTNGPAVINDITTESCYLSSISDANRLFPSSCNQSSFVDSTSIGECIEFNPCLQGRLTFVPESGRDLIDSPFLVTSEGLTTRLACIPGVDCGSGKVPVFDWKSGQSVCVSIT